MNNSSTNSPTSSPLHFRPFAVARQGQRFRFIPTNYYDSEYLVLDADDASGWGVFVEFVLDGRDAAEAQYEARYDGEDAQITY